MDKRGRARKAKGENRSGYWRDVVEEILDREQESDAVATYINGYREIPESAGEVNEVLEICDATSVQNPWE